MRVLAAILTLIFASLFATVGLAQAALTECPSVELTRPTDGAVLDPGYRVNFTWNSEPRGTAKREWVSVKVDLEDESFSFEGAERRSAEPGLYKGFARGAPGVYAWAVIFYDAKGNPICQSEAKTYFVTGTGFPEAPANYSGAAYVAKISLGRYVIVLTGQRGRDNEYKGTQPYLEVQANDYDGTGKVPAGYDGLEIWGNNNNNRIKGSELNDLIYGGNEFCVGLLCVAGDEIDGGLGDDTINGGNEACIGVICGAGDVINGGGGNDTINGGNNFCLGLAFCGAGDIIRGGTGNDTINGGNELCVGAFCLAGDFIDAGDGNDTITGGTETCVGLICNAGDIIDGGAGTDTNIPGGPNVCIGLVCGNTDQVTATEL